jgi:tRNA(His) 5'-end guanylyltransferase
MTDKLGDRMKMYEQDFLQQRFMPLLPIVARIDGAGFSKFTRGMDRPYDLMMQQCMIETCRKLVEETGASMGFTQSDEITLTWHSTSLKYQVWFDGRVSKMISRLAAKATRIFYQEVLKFMPEYADRDPEFDARVYNVPNRAEGTNTFVWREWDATKNSLQMVGHAEFGHSGIYRKNGKQIKDMLMDKGINWNRFPVAFKRGTYIQRSTVTRPFTPEEISELPPKHNYFSNPDLVVRRSIVKILAMPPITTVVNRSDVMYEGAEPVTAAMFDGQRVVSKDILKL